MLNLVVNKETTGLQRFNIKVLLLQPYPNRKSLFHIWRHCHLDNVAWSSCSRKLIAPERPGVVWKEAPPIQLCSGTFPVWVRVIHLCAGVSGSFPVWVHACHTSLRWSLGFFPSLPHFVTPLSQTTPSIVGWSMRDKLGTDLNESVVRSRRRCAVSGSFLNRTRRIFDFRPTFLQGIIVQFK